MLPGSVPRNDRTAIKLPRPNLKHMPRIAAGAALIGSYRFSVQMLRPTYLFSTSSVVDDSIYLPNLRGSCVHPRYSGLKNVTEACNLNDNRFRSQFVRSDSERASSV